MRPGQQNKRGRGRNNNNNRKGGNPLSRSYDSSGPDVKIRGTAQHIAEKYANLARDAQSSGDNVMAENYLQHAEHYNRIIAAAQAQMQERYQRDDRDGSDRDDRDDSERMADDHSDTYQGNGYERGHGNGHDRGHDRGQDRPNGSGNDRSNARAGSGGGESDDAQRDAQPHINGSGPQPVIEGMPAEVTMEDETPAAGTRRTTSRRRTAAARPKRARKSDTAPSENSGDDGRDAKADDGDSSMAEAASE